MSTARNTDGSNQGTIDATKHATALHDMHGPNRHTYTSYKALACHYNVANKRFSYVKSSQSASFPVLVNIKLMRVDRNCVIWAIIAFPIIVRWNDMATTTVNESNRLFV